MAKRQDAIDKAIEAAWYKLASGVQVNIMVIPTIFRECREAIVGGKSVDEAVAAAVAKYRLN